MFDWNQMIENIPTEWRATEGKGVKIAVLDSGAQLGHPAFAHLIMPGHKFWVGKPGFNPMAPLPPGNDDVSDALPGGFAHGTAILSVLAGLSPATDPDGLKGVAPQAEYFVLKVANPQRLALDSAVLNAIELAVKLGADIITCSVLPIVSGTVTPGRLEEVFGKLVEKRVHLFTTLDNTSLLSVLNNLVFPSNQAASIVTGVAKPNLLAALPPGDTFDLRIAFLHPAVPITHATAAAYESLNCRSSQSVAAMAGIAALQIAVWKAAEQQNYQPRTRAALLSALNTVAQPFSVGAMQSATAPGYFNPNPSQA